MLKVKLYGKKYFAKHDKHNNYIFLYEDAFHYILDIPSINLTIMYAMHLEATKIREGE